MISQYGWKIILMLRIWWKKIRKIDFYFFSLEEIRKKIINILDKYLQGKII